MAFHYENVVPWGRSHAEYLRMFDLGPEELAGRILGCADGPASFNCERTSRGGRVVSVDPLYALAESRIRERIGETYADVMAQTRRERHRFVWDTIGSVEELGRVRMNAMQAFLADYETGRRQGRYVAAALPFLPFRDGEFDLVLCSHFLFFYAEQLPPDLHRAGLSELCRVGREVRIFPLVDVNGERSPHVDPALLVLTRRGLRVEMRRVAYEFQRGGNEMLRVRA